MMPRFQSQFRMPAAAWTEGGSRGGGCGRVLVAMALPLLLWAAPSSAQDTIGAAQREVARRAAERIGFALTTYLEARAEVFTTVQLNLCNAVYRSLAVPLDDRASERIREIVGADRLAPCDTAQAGHLVLDSVRMSLTNAIVFARATGRNYLSHEVAQLRVSMSTSGHWILHALVLSPTSTPGKLPGLR